MKGCDTGWPWPALVALSACMLLPSLSTSIAHVALPALAQAFGAPMPHVQWVVIAYLLTTTALLVTAGRLGDVLGRKRLLLAGIVVFTAASALCGAAAGLGWLIAARALQGAGGAVLMALTMALVADVVPTSHTGRAMGLLGTMSAVGTALGPSLGGLLLAKAGWPAVFLVSVPVGALAGVLVLRCLPAGSRAVAAAGFDGAGTMLLGCALAAYALAMTSGGGHFGAANLVLLGVCAGAVVLLVRVERAARAPLLDIAKFRDPALSASLVAGAIASAVVMATLVVGPFHLGGTLRLGEAQVGLAMSVGPALAALAGWPAGRLVDRFGAARVAFGGMLAMLAGCAALAAARPAWGVAGYLLPLAWLTAGYALFQAANNTRVMGGVAAGQRGVLSGLVNLSRNLGFITGASAMGALFAAGGLRTAFGFAAVLVLLALLATRAGHPRRAVPQGLTP